MNTVDFTLFDFNVGILFKIKSLCLTEPDDIILDRKFFIGFKGIVKNFIGITIRPNKDSEEIYQILYITTGSLAGKVYYRFSNTLHIVSAAVSSLKSSSMQEL